VELRLTLVSGEDEVQEGLDCGTGRKFSDWIEGDEDVVSGSNTFEGMPIVSYTYVGCPLSMSLEFWLVVLCF